jgi:uracil-DNA glycosylase family 4
MADSSADTGIKLRRFWRRAVRCRVCPTVAPWRKFPVDSHGMVRYRLMIVGEAPGRVSLANRRAFSNPRNLMLRKAFARAVAPRRLELEDVFYLTDVVKCRPSAPGGANRSPLQSEVTTCIARHLMRELEIVRPRLVLAFGVRAASATLGYPVKLAQAHGKPHASAAGVRVIPLMHPSSINIVGMRSVGIGSLAQYEEQLANLIHNEVASLLT